MAVFASFSAAFAQDTLIMFDTFYMYTPFDDRVTHVDCKYWVYANNQRTTDVPRFILYNVPTPTTIYGVAIAPTMDLSLYNWDSVLSMPDVEITAIIFAKEGPGDRSGAKAASHVSLKDHPAGLYVLEIQTAEGLFTAKVVRQ